MNVTIKQLRAFVCIATTGSFTRAADRLCVTQSALSVVIRELEVEVGVKLLKRTTRTVLLTDAGREFLKSAHRVLADLECAVRDARDEVARQQGQVSLGVPPMAAATFIPEMLAALKAAHPEIRVVLHDIRPDEIAARAATGEIDFGLGTFDSTLEPLRRIIVARQPFGLFCAQRHPLASRDSVVWSDLRHESLITIAHDNTVQRLLKHAFGQSGYSASSAYEVYHALTVLAMVAAGLGVAVLPTWARSGLRLYDICVRNIVDPVVSTELVVISHPARESSPAMLKFERFFTSFLSRLMSDERFTALHPRELSHAESGTQRAPSQSGT